MAQILVVNELSWYQAIAALDNYYEIDVENRILKHADEVFDGYYSLKGKYTFNNSAGETSDGDILLISKDFSKWVIVEVELASKASLGHTRKQLRVFTSCGYDIDSLVKYCQTHHNGLGSFTTQLKNLFTNNTPEVLVMFDAYHQTRLGQLQSEFPSIKICVFEIYKTASHDFETYRLSGDYPYVHSGYTFLKDTTGFEVYEVQRPDLLTGIPAGSLNIEYKMGTYRVQLMSAKSKLYMKIPRNPFPPGVKLLLYKTITNKFFIDTIN
nr:hypothetical protein [uncultured Chitinophaga sp.]